MTSLKIKNTIFGEGIPKICIPIVGNTEAEIYESADRISHTGCDAVEWRADYYADASDISCVSRILAELSDKLSDKILLFTFRTKKEGGTSDLPDAEYLRISSEAAGSGYADMIDLEFSIGIKDLAPVMKAAKENDVKVILSNHEFEKTPSEEEMLRRLAQMEKAGCDIAKLAVMPNSSRDVLALLSATARAHELISCPIITMSMGDIGRVSRISGALTGSCMTFGTSGEASAPGQLSCDSLEYILRALS